MTDEQYMQEALKEAQLAQQEGEVPVGAVIVCDGKIIARGHNRRETTNDIFGHAEIEAIKKACDVLGCWHLENCSLYVNLEPCPMCAGAIQQARVGHVFFGCYDSKAGALGGVYDLSIVQGLNFNTIIHPQIMEKECAKLLKDFFKKLR